MLYITEKVGGDYFDFRAQRIWNYTQLQHRSNTCLGVCVCVCV